MAGPVNSQLCTKIVIFGSKQCICTLHRFPPNGDYVTTGELRLTWQGLAAALFVYILLPPDHLITRDIASTQLPTLVMIGQL